LTRPPKKVVDRFFSSNILKINQKKVALANRNSIFILYLCTHKTGTFSTEIFMQIVTLTTDWGNKDFFAGMVKGKLYSTIPGVNVVDITHGIEPFDLTSTSFVVKNACPNFPKGTIHIIDVRSFITKTDNFVVVEYQEQYYICTDNKIPYSIFGDKFTTAVEIDVHWDSYFYNFAAYDLFCKVAAMIAQGLPLEKIGPRKDELNKSQAITYINDENSIRAYIMYIDSYGNAYLNVTYEKFAEISRNRSFSVCIQSEEKKFSTIFDSFGSASKDSEMVVTASSTGYIVIGLKIASAEQLLHLKVRDPILIKFF
jgi:S-adenosylmethionine hydrolase